MSTARRTAPLAAPRRRVPVRLIGWALVALVLAAILLDTTYVSDDAPPRTASGRAAFDPDAYGAQNYPKVVAAIEDRAVPAATLLGALDDDEAAATAKYGVKQGTSPATFSVSGTGVAGEARAGIMPVRIAGLPADTTVSLQVGPAINGTSIRDASGTIDFNQFVNQVDFADAATSLNDRVKSEVLAGLPKDLEGKRVSFTGAFSFVTTSVVTVTPIALEVR